MRVALGQIDMVWEDKKASLVKAEKMVKEAAAAKADIIIFPEMTLTGFSMALDKIGEEEPAAETVKIMGELSVQNHIATGFGWRRCQQAEARKGLTGLQLREATGKLSLNIRRYIHLLMVVKVKYMRVAAIL